MRSSRLVLLFVFFVWLTILMAVLLTEPKYDLLNELGIIGTSDFAMVEKVTYYSGPDLSTYDKRYSKEDIVRKHINEHISRYSNLDVELVLAMAYKESSYNPNAKNGDHYGLLQINPKWHKDRMARLGVDDLYNLSGNLLVGMDYLSELIDICGGRIELALMSYNMGCTKAKQLYDSGVVSKYAKSILSMREELK